MVLLPEIERNVDLSFSNLIGAWFQIGLRTGRFDEKFGCNFRTAEKGICYLSVKTSVITIQRSYIDNCPGILLA
jgi:hypothetical protein